MHDSLDWKSDDRAPWVTNSLRARITDLRAAEKRCRNAFTKPYMGEPANYLADAYAEAADLLEAKLPTAHALENGPAGLADAHTNPASPSLSSLRKGAEDMREAVLEALKQAASGGAAGLADHELAEIADGLTAALVCREDGE